MPRALVMAERTVTSEEREDYFNALAVRRAAAAAARVNFWVFESRDRVGCFLEFMEAATVELLHAAIDAWRPGAGTSPHLDVWNEVKALR